MNQDFKYELSLTRLTRNLDRLDLTDFDRQYLLTNIPQFFQLIVQFIKKGYFERFMESGHINFLDIGCHHAHLAFLIEDIKKVFYSQGYNVTASYLGIDINSFLMSRLQNQFPQAQGYFFRAMDASDSVLLREAMLQTIPEGPDVVLFKRPVMIGIGWQRWLWHFSLILGFFRIASVFGRIRRGGMTEEFKNILSTLVLSFFYSKFAVSISEQYGSFLKVMTGSAASNFDNALILSTNTNWIEFLLTKNRLSYACNSTVETGTLSAAPVYDLSWFHWERYYTLVQEFHFHPSYFTLENILNSNVMAGIPFLIALNQISYGRPLSRAFADFIKTAFIHSLTIPIAAVMWEMIPYLFVIMKLGLFSAIASVSGKPNTIFTSLGLLLLFLPAVDGGNDSRNVIGNYNLSIPINILSLTALMSLIGKTQYKPENKPAVVAKTDSDFKPVLNEFSRELKKIAVRIQELPNGLKSQYKFILSEYQDLLEEIQHNPTEARIQDFKQDLLALKRDLADDLTISKKTQVFFAYKAAPPPSDQLPKSKSIYF